MAVSLPAIREKRRIQTGVRYLPFLFLIGCLYGLPVQAAQVNVGFGLLVNQFDYQETEPEGDLINEEEGILPGVIGQLTFKKSPWFGATEFSYLEEDVDYKDHRIAQSSTTSTRITRLVGIAGRQWQVSDSVDIDVYAGVGRRDWRRDIHSTTSAVGLLEKYHWNYAILGVRPVLNISAKQKVMFDLRLRQVLSGGLDVDIKDNRYGKTVGLELDEGKGIRLSLDWRYRLSSDKEIGIAPYADYWMFDRSPSVVVVNQNTGFSDSLHEPENKTFSTGIMFWVSKSF